MILSQSFLPDNSETESFLRLPAAMFSRCPAGFCRLVTTDSALPASAVSRRSVEFLKAVQEGISKTVAFPAGAARIRNDRAGNFTG